MWSFALLALALIAVSLALLLRPMLAGRPSARPRGDANLDIHRERLRDVDADFAAGRITAEERDAVRREIERELLDDLEDSPPAPGDSAPAWRSAVAVAVLVPLLASGIYLHLGAWEALVPAAEEGEGDDSAVLLESLEAAARANPGDAEGWLRLGRAAVALERNHLGLQAFAEAHRLAGDRADLLADYAEAEALVMGYRFVGNPSRRLERALELDPRHRKALWLAGFAALQNARPELAIERWETLLAQSEPGSEQARLVEALVARTREETGAAAPGPAEEIGEAGPVLLVTVHIEERFRAGLDGSESLFVYARAAGGPPAPLVARREAARDFPLTLRLDDSMRMIPERTLAGAERVEVGARISRSGDARARSGDIQGLSGTLDIRAGEIHVEVVLDERVP